MKNDTVLRFNLVKILHISPIFLLASCSSGNLSQVRNFSAQTTMARENIILVTSDFHFSCIRESHLFPISLTDSNSPDSNADEDPAIQETRNVRNESQSGEFSVSEFEEFENSLRMKKETLKANIEQKLTSIQEDGKVELPDDINLSTMDIDRAQKDYERYVQIARGLSSAQGSDALYKSRIYARLCNSTSRNLSPAVRDGLGIVLVYGQKLGQVARANLTNFDTEFAELGTTAGEFGSELLSAFMITSVPPEQLSKKIGAGIDLIGFITNLIFESKRNETLKKVITNSDEALGIHIESMQKIIQNYYIDQLDSEDLFLRDYYEKRIRRTRENNQIEGVALSKTDERIEELEEKWVTMERELIQRRLISESLVGVLESIKQSHNQLAQLYKDDKEISEKLATELLQKNITAIKDFNTKVDAFLASEVFENNYEKPTKIVEPKN